jgi:hypothetical protein
MAQRIVPKIRRSSNFGGFSTQGRFHRAGLVTRRRHVCMDWGDPYRLHRRDASGCQRDLAFRRKRLAATEPFARHAEEVWFHGDHKISHVV